MHLVDKQDNVVSFGGLLDHVLEALLKLAAILGARDQTRQVECPDILVHKVLGYVAGGDLLGQALDDGQSCPRQGSPKISGLFGAARRISIMRWTSFSLTNYRVELAVARLLREVSRKLLERVGAAPLLLRAIRAAKERQTRTGTAGAGTGERTFLVLVLGGEFLDSLLMEADDTPRRMRMSMAMPLPSSTMPISKCSVDT